MFNPAITLNKLYANLLTRVLHSQAFSVKIVFGDGHVTVIHRRYGQFIKLQVFTVNLKEAKYILFCTCAKF